MNKIHNFYNAFAYRYFNLKNIQGLEPTWNQKFPIKNKKTKKRRK